MQNYLDLLHHTLTKGAVKRNERTGAKTVSVIGQQLRYYLPDGFPLVTTSKKHLRSIIEELLWFLRGATMNTELNAVGVTIWDEWAVKEDVYASTSLGVTQRYELWKVACAAGKVSPENVAKMYDVIEQMLTAGIRPPNAPVPDEPAAVANSDVSRTDMLDLVAGTGFGYTIPNAWPIISGIMTEAGIPETTNEIPLSGYDRASIYAEDNGLQIADVLEMLQQCDRDSDAWSAETSEGPKPLDGHEFLDNAGIPEGRLHICVPKGALGPIYGAQWRFWPTHEGTHVDQIAEAIKSLRERPFSRRNIVSAWNPSFLPDESLSAQENVKRGKMSLAPCHAFYQFLVDPIELDARIELYTAKKWPDRLYQYMLDSDPVIALYRRSMGEMTADVEATLNAALAESKIPDKRLHCVLTQRSADMPLGVPYNIASYALLTMMVAQVVGMQAGELVMNFGDLHIYENQIEGVREQLSRKPHPLPTMLLNPDITDIDDFKFSDFCLVGYTAEPTIKYDITV